MKTVKVCVVRVGKDPAIEEMEDSLEAMQKTVGGYVEPHFSHRLHGYIYCNEDGRSLKLPDNRAGFVGDFFIANVNGKGELTSLTEEQIKDCLQIFKLEEK